MPFIEKPVTYKDLLKLDTLLVRVEQSQQRSRRKGEIVLPVGLPTQRINGKGERVALNGKVTVEVEEEDL